MKLRIFGAFCAIAIAATAIYFVFADRSPRSFAWENGASYKAELRLAIESNKPIFLNAKLHLKKIKEDDRTVTAQAIITGASIANSPMQASESEAAKLGAIVVFDRNGAIADLEIPSYIDADLKLLIERVILTPETVLGAIYATSIVGEKERFRELENGAIEKTIETKGGAKKVKSSKYVAVLSNKFWLKSFSGSERGSENGFGYESSADYEQIAFDESQFSADPAATQSKLREEYLNFAEKQAPQRTVSADEFARSFLALDGGKDGYFAMVDRLRNNPYLMDEIPDLLLKYAADNDIAARTLIGVLEYVGDARAQRTLAKIMSSQEQSEGSRIRAIVALNGVKNPTIETLDALKANSAVRGDESLDFLANSSYLALGSALGKFDADDPAYKNAVREMIGDLASASGAPTSTKLLALGNTRDKELYDEAKRYFDSEDSFTRSRALIAGSMLDNGEYFGDAKQVLAKESAPFVRSEIYKSFGAMQNGGGAQVKAYMAKAVFDEKSGEARKPIVDYLKQNAGDEKIDGALKTLLGRRDLAGPNDRIEIRRALRHAHPQKPKSKS